MKCCAIFPLQKLEIYIKTFRMRAHNVSEVEGENFKQIQFGETISETRETFQFLDLNRTGDKTLISCVSAWREQGREIGRDSADEGIFSFHRITPESIKYSCTAMHLVLFIVHCPHIPSSISTVHKVCIDPIIRSEISPHMKVFLAAIHWQGLLL